MAEFEDAFQQLLEGLRTAGAALVVMERLDRRPTACSSAGRTRPIIQILGIGAPYPCETCLGTLRNGGGNQPTARIAGANRDGYQLCDAEGNELIANLSGPTTGLEGDVGVVLNGSDIGDVAYTIAIRDVASVTPSVLLESY
jgi:hypothetical protein